MKKLEVGRYEIKGIMEIDDAALFKIYDFVNINVVDQHMFRNEVVHAVGTNWVGDRGTWPKRVARRLKKLGIKISNDHLSVIGKIARESCITGKGYVLYVKNKVDWSQGDYADDGSCYWNTKQNAKKMIRDAGGGALCLHIPDAYSDNCEQKLARCWWVPHEESIIIFNGYTNKGDDMSLTTFSRIVMDLTEGTYYRKIGLDNRGTSDGLLWINSSMGFIIGDESVQDIQHVSLDILPYCHECGETFTERENVDDYRTYCDNCYNEDEDTCECYDCGVSIHEEDEYCVNDHYYCEECYHQRFRYCESCGSDVRRGDGEEVNGQFVCDECLQEYYFKCCECDEWLHVDDGNFDTPSGEGYCQDCHDKVFKYCDLCGAYYFNEDVYYLDGMNRCIYCAQEKYVQCDRCHEWTRKDEVFTMAYGVYCNHCVVWNEEVA